MKYTASILLAACLGMAGVAAAQSLIMTEGAYELNLRYVTFPGGGAGTLTFRRCDSCNVESARVTPATRYSTSIGLLDQPSFQQRVEEVRDETAVEGNASVTVFYSLQSGDVTRIVLHDSEGQ